MKVCTDSCLFGAWAADWLQKNKLHTQTILDIGAGTGLLSLMLAQKLSSATIDAVEIEPLCFEQAATNISQSIWKERMRLHHCDINEFATLKQYDVIISNPPFYESDLASGNAVKNIAHHNTGLTLQSLLTVVKRLLHENGCFTILLPYHRYSWFENEAAGEGFFINERVLIKQTTQHSFFRVFMVFSRVKTDISEHVMAIKNPDNFYTPVFISLLKDYYLHL